MKLLKTRSAKDKVRFIIQIIFCLYCFTDLKNYWFFSIIFIILIFFNIRLYKKHKQNEEQIEVFLDKGLDINKNPDGSKKISKKETENLRKQSYENFLKQVEEDFPEDEFEEEEE